MFLRSVNIKPNLNLGHFFELPVKTTQTTFLIDFIHVSSRVFCHNKQLLSSYCMINYIKVVRPLWCIIYITIRSRIGMCKDQVMTDAAQDQSQPAFVNPKHQVWRTIVNWLSPGEKEFEFRIEELLNLTKKLVYWIKSFLGAEVPGQLPLARQPVCPSLALRDFANSLSLSWHQDFSEQSALFV